MAGDARRQRCSVMGKAVSSDPSDGTTGLRLSADQALNNTIDRTKPVEQFQSQIEDTVFQW